MESLVGYRSTLFAQNTESSENIPESFDQMDELEKSYDFDCVDDDKPQVDEGIKQFIGAAIPILSTLNPQLGNTLQFEFTRKEEIMSFLYGSGADQNEYQMLTNQAIQEAAQLLTAKVNDEAIEEDSFNQVIDFLAKKRGELAVRAQTSFAENFGVRRNATFMTKLNGRYLEWLPKSMKLCEEKIERIKSTNNPEINPDELTFYQFQFQNSNGKNYPLTTLECFPDSSYKPDEIFSPKIVHSRPGPMKELLNEVIGPLFNHIMKSKNFTREELLASIAQLHWLLAHAMPFERGSAAIAENLIRSLLLVKLQCFPIYKEKIFPDLEALTNPDIAEFQSSYINMFHEFEKNCPKTN